MLARRLTAILPAMPLAEAIETTRIHRVAGLTGDRAAWVTTRPCRAPHHTISDVGLIGGGHLPMSGDVSLVHHGVLFLDALPEFRIKTRFRSSSPPVPPETEGLHQQQDQFDNTAYCRVSYEPSRRSKTCPMIRAK
jgi:Magnesium chelatase, subunit ChlI